MAALLKSAASLGLVLTLAGSAGCSSAPAEASRNEPRSYPRHRQLRRQPNGIWRR